MTREKSPAFCIPAPVLEAFTADLFESAGFTAEEGRVTAESLVAANLAGHDSHGVLRVPEYIARLDRGIIRSGVALRVLCETDAILLCDAQAGLGQVQMTRLLDRAIPKARSLGVATAVLRGSAHVGRVGEWVEYLAWAGCAGLVLVNDNGAVHFVAPPGGIAPVTSTNPLAFGLPVGKDEDGDAVRGDFIFDTSTSATAIGKMRLAALDGREVPDGLLQDAQGHPSRDPAVLFTEPRGAILPMGGAAQGYKGFGLSMMVDLLVAGLSGGYAPPAPEGVDDLNNVVVMIWDPERFSGAAHMAREAGKYCAHLHTVPPVDPEKPIRLAGERARQETQRRMRLGIPLSLAVTESLRKQAGRLGVSIPQDLSC